MDLVYLDYAAATPTDERVAQKVASISTAVFGNPSSVHGFGGAAWSEMTEARQIIANFIAAKPDEIFFTASGTESNNLAILGVARANKNRGRHIVTTAVEHPSVLNACRALEKDGWRVTYLPVDENGQISASDLKKSLTKETILFITNFGNSELGTLPDIEKLSAICRSQNVLVHIDACQATAYELIDVQKMNVDLLTFNGSKMYGPKGVAVLYVREGVQIFPLMYGGGQEQSLRSGTENVAGIVGLATAARIIEKNRTANTEKIGKLRDWLQTALEKLPNVTINGQTGRRLPNHLSVTFNGAQERDLVKYFDQHCIGVSAGSACGSKSIGESHVLTAIGLTNRQAQATVRVTLGRPTTKQQCQTFLRVAAKLAN